MSYGVLQVHQRCGLNGHVRMEKMLSKAGSCSQGTWNEKPQESRTWMVRATMNQIIGVMFTKLAFTNWGTTLCFTLPSYK